MPRLLVLGAALLFSTGGLAIKSCDLSSWQVASFRCGVAALTLWLLLPAARRRWRGGEALVGCAYAATLVCYAVATKLTTAANAIFLQSAAPLYVLVLAWWLLGERSNRRDLGFATLMVAGLVLVLSGQDAAGATAPDPTRGNLFGALTGVFWALTVVGLRRLSNEERSGGAESDGSGSSAAALVAGNVVGFVACLPLALSGDAPLWSPAGGPGGAVNAVDWAWIVYLGVVQIGLAYLLLTAGLRRVPAFEASLLLLAEPVFNPLWTWLLHGEVPSSPALLGGFLILSATTTKTWVDFRSGRGKPAEAP
ncbi:MAG: DMT family transporter [Thermoanaerobaculia bacterium]|nr:DMT family transporter [Thermoanaerobaculia bacterium]